MAEDTPGRTGREGMAGTALAIGAAIGALIGLLSGGGLELLIGLGVGANLGLLVGIALETTGPGRRPPD